MILRLFVAIPLTEEIKQSIYHYQKRLEISAKFVEEENLHITVYFLGSQEDTKIQTIINSITQETKAVKPFTLQFDSIKATPSRNPRLIAAWYKDNPIYQRLVELGSKCAEKKLDRKQLPHITLARFREINSVRKANLHEQTFDQILVKEIQLVYSKLTPQGPEYEILHTFPLGS